MKKTFEVNLKFIVEVDCSEADIDEEEDSVLSLIKSYITEFLKHPHAIETYYKNYFIDTFFNDCIESDAIKEKLGYQLDLKELFIGIAPSCSPGVAQFINYIFKNTEDKKSKSLNVEWVRELLDKQFGTLKVLKAEFKATDEHRQTQTKEAVHA